MGRIESFWTQLRTPTRTALLGPKGPFYASQPEETWSALCSATNCVACTSEALRTESHVVSELLCDSQSELYVKVAFFVCSIYNLIQWATAFLCKISNNDRHHKRMG